MTGGVVLDPQRRAGAKGFGLFTNQDLEAGQFVIQYLGEVLEEEEYVRRKVRAAISVKPEEGRVASRLPQHGPCGTVLCADLSSRMFHPCPQPVARVQVYYQATGQRHYYFMNVGNGEVIDACRKVTACCNSLVCSCASAMCAIRATPQELLEMGHEMMGCAAQGALGRFINHSCDPNCETQKWVVQGELAIGLFASKPIQAGTELTFDYNFERYGDKVLLRNMAKLSPSEICNTLIQCGIYPCRFAAIPQ